MSGHSLSGSWVRRRLHALALLVLVAGIAASFPPVGSAASVATCSKAVGPFRVQGTRVLQGDGKVFVPYGVTLSTLQYYPGTYLDAYKDQTTLEQTEAQIRAIADGWCGNTVRLQVEQDMLVGVKGNEYNSKYMSVVESAVRYAESLGLVVVVNAQTEPGGASDTTDNEPLPTAATEAFWHDMDRVYAHDPHVVYDTFNEPRPFTTPAKPERTYWNEWLDGGAFTYTYKGKRITIHGIGQQALANYIRRDGSTNLLWVEGAVNLDYLVKYPQTYLIKGDGPIAYNYHHTANGLPHDPATWNAQFGGLVEHNIAPVVDGEWTNYATNTGYTYPNGDSGECWSDAPKTVPVYLQYLHNLGIGMTVWTMAAGFMNSTPGNYVAPSEFESNWKCARGLDQGAGQDVQDWFFQNNSVPAPTPTPAPKPTPPRQTAPMSTAAPTVSGRAQVGQTLSCSTGSWTGSPTAYAYQWTDDGTVIPDATNSTYKIASVDRGQSLSCTVTASNAAGRTSSTSAGVMIPAVNVRTCPPPSGRLNGARLGPVWLGETRRQARRQLPRFAAHNRYTDSFCLSRGSGITVGYAHAGNSRSPGALAKSGGNIVLALTANRHYALHGLRPGTRLANVPFRFRLDRPIRVGADFWYVLPGAISNGVVKVRDSIVREVGIASRKLTANRVAQARLLRRF